MASVKIKATFPSPVDRPDGYVLIYDGHCKFCIANIRLLRSIDEGRIAYLSLHDPEVASRWPDLSHEQLMQQMYLVDDEQKYGGAAALRFLSRKLKCLWILAPLLHLPGTLPLWQYLYKFIAKIRYRFGRIEDCDGDSCSLHFK